MHSEFLDKTGSAATPLSAQAVTRAPHTERLGALVAAFVLVLALLIVPAQQAFGHDYLMGSNPEDGATLDTHPSQVVLSFNNNIQNLGAQMIIMNENEDVVASGEPTVTGKNVSFDVPPNLGNGAFTINWRVVSSDSHPIDGTLDYSVTGEPETEGTPAQPEATATPALPGQESTDSPSPQATPISAPVDAPQSPGLPWPGIFIGGGLGLAVGIILLLLGKRKDKNRADN